MVEARAHVRITRFSRVVFSLAIFWARFWSMKGPFLSERLTYRSSHRGLRYSDAPYPLSLLPSPDDQLVGRLLRLTGAQAQCGLAPRRLRVAARPGLALTATVRVVGRIHGRTPHRRPCAHPARTSGLAPRLVFMLQVSDLPQRGNAPHVDAPQLARRHADDGVVPFFGKELSRRAGRPHELAATAEGQLDVVDGRADRDPRERHGVAHPDRSVGAAHDLVTDFEPQRGKDVPLLAVTVVNQGDASGAIGV